MLVKLSKKYHKWCISDRGDKMNYVSGESRDQLTLLPECIEDYVTKDNSVQVIDAFVNSL